MSHDAGELPGWLAPPLANIKHTICTCDYHHPVCGVAHPSVRRMLPIMHLIIMHF
jgi:hypothetical protein